MIDVISESEKKQARKAHKTMLLIWFACLVFTLGVVGTLIGIDIYLVSALRNRDHTIWMGVLAAFVSIVFACGSYFFFAIKFRLTHKYVRMLKDMETGLKDEIVAKFLEYDEAILTKDGVDMYTMKLEARPLKREDISERNLLVASSVDKPKIEPGTKLKIISHANILISYEIIK